MSTSSISNSALQNAWTEMAQWANSAKDSDAFSIASQTDRNVSSLITYTVGGKDMTSVCESLLKRKFSVASTKNQDFADRMRAATNPRQVVRQEFLAMVKQMCGLPVDAPNSALPKNVQHAMKLDGGIIERHDWDEDKARPLTARRIKAVAAAVNAYTESAEYLRFKADSSVESSFFHTEGGKKFFEKWHNTFDPVHHRTSEIQLRNVPLDIKNDIAEGLILLGPDHCEKHLISAMVSRHEQIAQLAKENKLTLQTLFQVLVSPIGGKLVDVPDSLSPKKLSTARDKGILFKRAIDDFVEGHAGKKTWMSRSGKATYNLGRFAVGEFNVSPDLTKDSIYMKTGAHFIFDEDSGGAISGAAEGVARDFCREKQKMTISFDDGRGSQKEMFLLSENENQSLRKNDFVAQMSGERPAKGASEDGRFNVFDEIEKIGTSDLQKSAMKTAFKQNATSMLRVLLREKFNNTEPNLFVSSLKFSRNEDNSITISYKGNAHALKEEDRTECEGAEWTQSYTIYEDGRYDVNDLTFDGLPL